MDGSIRRRSSGSWELRVYAGVDPEIGQQRYRTATVRGARAEGERELGALVAAVRAESAGGRARRAPNLLDRFR